MNNGYTRTRKTTNGKQYYIFLGMLGSQPNFTEVFRKKQNLSKKWKSIHTNALKQTLKSTYVTIKYLNEDQTR